VPQREALDFRSNPFGDEGIAALVAPPLPPASAPPPMTTGVLTKLRMLDLSSTQITDAGGAALAAAFDRGAFPATGVPIMRFTIDRSFGPDVHF
jgi:hypothetical protein